MKTLSKHEVLIFLALVLATLGAMGALFLKPQGENGRYERAFAEALQLTRTIENALGDTKVLVSPQQVNGEILVSGTVATPERLVQLHRVIEAQEFQSIVRYVELGIEGAPAQAGP